VFSLCLFICLFVSRITRKLLKKFFTKFGGNVAHGPRKNPLDFSGNPDHATVRVSVDIQAGL